MIVYKTAADLDLEYIYGNSAVPSDIVEPYIMMQVHYT